MPKKLTTLLSIAGSDPTGGAGIQADIRVGAFMGVHVMTAITALTVQNSKGVKEINPVSSELLESQLGDILDDCLPDAIKIGLIGSKDNFLVIHEFLNKLPADLPVVVDPILRASANDKIMSENSDIDNLAKIYIDLIFPLTTVATPNKSELSLFKKICKVKNLNYEVITNLFNLKNLIVTGDTLENGDLIERLYTDKDYLEFRHPCVDSINLHGTGCVYSSLLACHLAENDSLVSAFGFSNMEMSRIIKRSTDYQLGNSNYGPLNINNYEL